MTCCGRNCNRWTISSTARQHHQHPARVALNYFEDGGVEAACPPLKALLHIMAHGEHEGKNLRHPDIRALFTREAMLASDWYQARLDAKVTVDQAALEPPRGISRGFPRQAELPERTPPPAYLDALLEELENDEREETRLSRPEPAPSQPWERDADWWK
jgi:hypothetical protein